MAEDSLLHLGFLSTSQVFGGLDSHLGGIQRGLFLRQSHLGSGISRGLDGLCSSFADLKINLASAAHHTVRDAPKGVERSRSRFVKGFEGSLYGGFRYSLGLNTGLLNRLHCAQRCTQSHVNSFVP